MNKKLFILLFIQEATAISLSQCGTDNVLELVFGENSVAVCSGLAGQRVEWRYLVSGVSNNIGFCDAVNRCTNLLAPDFMLSRSSDAESTVTIKPKDTLNGSITCQTGSSSDSCLMDSVIPAEGSCIVEFRRNTTPWSVFSQCTITRAYSERGRFSCQWYQIYQTTTETPLGSSDIATQPIQAGEKNVKGSCVLPTTGLLPRNEGSYSYKVTFTPGRNNVTASFTGTNEILRPTLPIITCNNTNFLPENTNITCVCQISRIGKPGGKLKVFWLDATHQPTLVNTGNFDIQTLVMTPQTLNRNDNGRLFRCELEWAENIIGNSTSIKVGYLDQTVMRVNTLMNLTVTENQIVTFTCSADGRPTPLMSLMNKDNGTLIKDKPSPLNHTLPVRCEDTSTYTCVASNGMGKNTTSASNLYVNCGPRIRSGAAPPVPLFELEVIQNQTASSLFAVIAYPTPNNFTFTFIGHTLAENIASSDLKGLILNATCRERKELYISDCNITAFNDNSYGGFYVVTVANVYGSANFTFEVAVNSTPSPIPPEVFSPGAAIGIGIAVAIVVIAAALIIIFVVWRKRKGPTKDTSSLHDRKTLYAENGNINAQDSKSINDSQCQTNPSFSLDDHLSGSSQHTSNLPAIGKNVIVNITASALAPEGTTSKESQGLKGLPLMMQPPVTESRHKQKKDKRPKKEQNMKMNKKQIKNTKETEYVNIPSHEMKKQTKASKEQGGLHNTAEGLTYMELDFSQNQPKKESHAAPVHETVEYAPIDFSLHPPKVQ